MILYKSGKFINCMTHCMELHVDVIYNRLYVVPCGMPMLDQYSVPQGYVELMWDSGIARLAGALLYK